MEGTHEFANEIRTVEEGGDGLGGVPDGDIDYDDAGVEAAISASHAAAATAFLREEETGTAVLIPGLSLPPSEEQESSLLLDALLLEAARGYRSKHMYYDPQEGGGGGSNSYHGEDDDGGGDNSMGTDTVSQSSTTPSMSSLSARGIRRHKLEMQYDNALGRWTARLAAPQLRNSSKAPPAVLQVTRRQR
jgi:hypothetical protein